ncbi:hypothetical protein [Camelimonas lactis]|uniref:hypothetical protein n=1 Tax=Camelimonas lactis TaxID=659006 RepID=UPI0014055AB2|nr:hypothetical protein [Camelimonas lactis]
MAGFGAVSPGADPAGADPAGADCPWATIAGAAVGAPEELAEEPSEELAAAPAGALAGRAGVVGACGVAAALPGGVA